MRSRKIVGWVISTKSADTDTVLRALHRGCASHGCPEKIYVDNGKVYDNRALAGQTKQMRLSKKIAVDKEIVSGVLAGLDIGITHAIAFNAKAKPVERFFGTLCQRFSKLQATYCGSNTLTRPENLKSKLQRDQAPGFDDFVADFEQWLEGDYHARAHHGDSMVGQTPATVFAAHLVEKRTANQDVLEVMLWKPTMARCGRNGVVCEGTEYGRGEPALYVWDTRKVLVSVDPDDANRAAIREVKTGRLICFARANQRLPFNTPKSRLKEAMAEIRREKKGLHDQYATRPRRTLDPAQRICADAVAKQRETDLAANHPAPVVKMISTPLSGDIERLQREMRPQSQLRIAAGTEADADSKPAEAMSLRDLMRDREKQMEEEFDLEREAKEAERADRQRFRDKLFGLNFGDEAEVQPLPSMSDFLLPTTEAETG